MRMVLALPVAGARLFGEEGELVPSNLSLSSFARKKSSKRALV